jgi:GNAT superfamily N-acetyltransferase
MKTSDIKETIKEMSYLLEYENDDSLEIRKILNNLYEFDYFKIDEAKQSILNIAGKKLYNYCKTKSIVLSTDNRDYDIPIVQFLENNGFKIKYSKILYVKNLGEHKFLYKDIFEYESIDEMGLEKFLKVFKQVVEDDPERDVDPEIYFNDLVEMAKEKYEPNNWKTVIEDGRYIGIIMPQIFPGQFDEGGIYNIGLIPDLRNKGFGRIMFSKCLDILKELGVKKYIGSTNVLNLPMIRVFELSGCNEWFQRNIYEAK